MFGKTVFNLLEYMENLTENVLSLLEYSHYNHFSLFTVTFPEFFLPLSLDCYLITSKIELISSAVLPVYIVVQTRPRN